MKNLRGFCNILMLGLAIIALASCSSARELVPTPNLFAGQNGYPSEEISPLQKTTTPKLFYITNRQPDGSGSYNSERSPSMAFGYVETAYGQDLSWSQLAQISSSSERPKPISLELKTVNEILRFPATPLPFSKINGKITTSPEPLAKYEAKKAELHKQLSLEIKKSNRKDVVLFVHGFANNFDNAAFSLADIWHFTGRVGIPMFFTWPAGNAGLTGYFQDAEAGNFSILHFKETIRMLSTTPGLERIHIVAHSRGTDVVTTGLRELVIEQRAKGNDPRKTLKIENLILAAPDLDFGVVRQRLIGERFGPAVGQITVYLNRNDGALGLSQRLVAGQRFGRLTFDDLGESEKVIFSHVKNVHFVDIPDVKGIIGHAYFRENPAVLSDVVISIRTSAIPGSSERPLENVASNFWELPKAYPFQKRPSN